MFIYPEKALFNRVLPKTKIYANAKPRRAIREKFVSHISEIVWKYKLAPDTINLPARDGYFEIEVFDINLKQPELSTDVLSAIDKAIPYPIFFRLLYGHRVKEVAAYKRPAADGSSSWVIEDYFESGWKKNSEPTMPLPVAVHLKSLYEQMLHAYIDQPQRPGEAFESLVERMRQVRKCQREQSMLEAQIKKEKQFNRKVEINTRLRNLKAQVAELTK